MLKEEIDLSLTKIECTGIRSFYKSTLCALVALAFADLQSRNDLCIKEIMLYSRKSRWWISPSARRYGGLARSASRLHVV
jgi:hypothetical protein